MLIINFPRSFKLGDTADCRINGKARRVTWRDKHMLVIEPDDARPIVAQQDDGGDLICFVCGNAGERASDYDTEMQPGGAVVAQK
jgi:hypothetical protein